MTNSSNSNALFVLMLRIITKKRDWIDRFITACRELNYQASSMFKDSNYETLADALEDFIGNITGVFLQLYSSLLHRFTGIRLTRFQNYEYLL